MKKIISILFIALFCFYLVPAVFAADSNYFRYNQVATAQQIVEKKFNTPQGSLTAEFNMHFTFSYDLGSGQIKSAYNEGVDNAYITEYPAGQDETLWSVQLKNIQHKLTVASDGSKATDVLTATMVVKYSLGSGEIDYRQWEFPVTATLTQNAL